MNIMNDSRLSVLMFRTTKSYPCSYFPEKQARSLVATPDHLVDAGIYEKLIRVGFRRSGGFTYRPDCDNCQACVPARVKVSEFLPNRSQRRTWKRHPQMTVKSRGLEFYPEHFSLYQRYQRKRHNGSGMDQDECDQYKAFLLQSNVNSELVEFHDNDQLCMISLVDKLTDGLSAVYTFYDPDSASASFGTYNVLWQIEKCRELNLSYVYLGYWIKENRKMSYKANFQPLEIFIDNCWQPFEV